MKKFKKAKIITTLCSAITIIGTTLFLASCSDNAIQQQTNSKVSEHHQQANSKDDEQKQKRITKTELYNTIQDIINEVIQEDNDNYQNLEEKNKVNKEVEEIAKRMFYQQERLHDYYLSHTSDLVSKDNDFEKNNDFKKADDYYNKSSVYGINLIIMTQGKILPEIKSMRPDLLEALEKWNLNHAEIQELKETIKAAKLKVKERFTQQVKDEAKNLALKYKYETQDKYEEFGIAEAEKFLENIIKQEISNKLNGRSLDTLIEQLFKLDNLWTSKDYWDRRIIFEMQIYSELFILNYSWMSMLKNSPLKSYIEQLERIFQKNKYYETYFNYHKYYFLGWINGSVIDRRTNKKVDEKVKEKVEKIVIKVFENETFQLAIQDWIKIALPLFVGISDHYSADGIVQKFRELNLI